MLAIPQFTHVYFGPSVDPYGNLGPRKTICLGSTEEHRSFSVLKRGRMQQVPTAQGEKEKKLNFCSI